MTASRRDFLKASAAATVMVGAGTVPATVWAASARRFKVANFYASGHSMNRALREVFVPKLEEYSGGDLTASIHDNSSLGSEKELTESLRLGAIEMGVTGGLLSASLPKLAVLELPYVFRDFAHAWRMFDGPTGDMFAAEFEKAGVKVLAWVGNGFRAISNSVRPINSLADTKGIRLRMPENKVYIETGKALGFSVVTMPFGEVFNALSQKVVDGQDNPPPTVLANKWYEVQEHLAISNHIFSYGAISINKSLFDGLPAKEKEAVTRAAKEAAATQRKMLEEDSAKDVATLEGFGMKITHPDIAELQKATAPVREQFAADIDGGIDLLKKIDNA